ncbi:hypothetical protein F9C07_2225122 [Aspergillus flavus]|uniref:Uncharacterized protein n=1 Tax=Aspergillus flavus (strain ATCC 200026 / FGSC A1120 / IAM 13836 / NRRL 3357 / JCM 12722 / SRRC 167) TaxID=332952 RepID=A0A7U2QRD8_ASPFN|nr:hypothetical protein AFLA_012471 [Aspergillus flavus NRRL3357]KAJ1706332.1 hypothetical protein NYO67_11516 [Aspergillus flavus]QRD81522.1 hypothetical protein F9C07_2225122 [Aspergillus flavus]
MAVAKALGARRILAIDGQGAPTNTHHIKPEAAFEEFPFNLGGDAVETDMAARENGSRGGRIRGSRGSYGGENESYLGFSSMSSGRDQWG